MVDLRQTTIKDLFYQQIKNMTQKNSDVSSFDIQFSDRWLR